MCVYLIADGLYKLIITANYVYYLFISFSVIKLLYWSTSNFNGFLIVIFFIVGSNTVLESAPSTGHHELCSESIHPHGQPQHSGAAGPLGEEEESHSP